MRRLLYIITFISIGLASAVASRSASAFIVNLTIGEQPRSGCYEIDHCNVPPLMLAILLSISLWPIFASAVMGNYFAGKKYAFPAQALALLSMFLSATLIHFLASIAGVE
jgi:hypothetical protein